MKSRTFIYLFLALAVLAGATWLTNRNARSRTNVVTGTAVIESFDPNALTRVQISSGTQDVVLARAENGWTVASLWNYPADFNRLSETLLGLERLKVGDVIRDGTATLADFGLAAVTVNQSPDAPTEVRWQTATASEAGYLVLGQPRRTASPDDFSSPDSQFARYNDGPVLVVAPYLEPPPHRAEEWLNREVMNVEGARVIAMNASLRDGTRYGVQRQGETLQGNDALAGKTINSQSGEMWLRTWQELNIATVLDPSGDRSAWGLDQPDVVEARTRDGLHLKVHLGNADEQGERPAYFTVNWEAPPLADGLEGEARVAAEKEQQAEGERAMALQKRITPWIYKLSGSTAQQFTMLQNQLIAAAPSTTNTPPATTGNP